MIYAQVSAVKQRISDEKGWDPKAQKLIYSGMTIIEYWPSSLREERIR